MDAEIQAQAFKADSYHMLQSLEEKDDLIREWAEFFEHFVRPSSLLPSFSFLHSLFTTPTHRNTSNVYWRKSWRTSTRTHERQRAHSSTSRMVMPWPCSTFRVLRIYDSWVGCSSSAAVTRRALVAEL